MVGCHGHNAAYKEADLSPCMPAEAGGAPVKRQISEDRDATVWKKDGSNGDYHSKTSLYLVMFAQILYIISLVIIIPTASRYAASLGATSSMYFGLIVGISSIIDPIVSRLWSSVIAITSLRAVLLTNACINIACSLMYVLAGCAGNMGGATLLVISRCLLGFGSVQTAYLQYLGRAVSIHKVTFAHFLATASISYGFAFGICLAFGLSFVADYCNWDQNLAPGWFTALLWFVYVPLHCLAFVEPDEQAGIVDPESKIRLTKEMRPKMRTEPFLGLLPCFIAIVVIGTVKGAFEVMTIEVAKHVWHWNVMKSTLFLGVVMFLVALTTLPAYTVQKRVGESRTFFYCLLGATLMLPVYYFPVTEEFHGFLNSTFGVVLYLVVSILTFSLFNVGRTIAFSLTTELPSPQWRDYFLANGSSLFTVGRGAGPIIVGALAGSWNTFLVLIVGCLVALMSVALAYSHGDLEHAEHEVGPARAEAAEPEQNVQKAVDQWLEWNGLRDMLDSRIGCDKQAKTCEDSHDIESDVGSPGLQTVGHQIVSSDESVGEGHRPQDSTKSFSWVFD